MMRTGIYVRVSTEEQATEGYSIRAQEEKLRAFVEIKDWTLHRVYADEGISGKNIVDRPAVNSMIQDIKDGYIDNVLVFKVDRLTRSTKDLIELVDIFNQCGCEFNSLTESIDTQTASGRMFLKIIGIFAEFERENMIERVKVGFERKVKEGYTLASRTASYGYDREKGEKIQTVNPLEAEVVKWIFNEYINTNKSMTQLAGELNQKGIKTKENSIWTAKTIKLVLTNVNYIGLVRYSIKDEKRSFEIDGKHESIISSEVFEEAQLKLSRIAHKSRTKRPKEQNFFSGTLYCGLCGRKLATHGSNRYLNDGTKVFRPGYRCVGKMNKVCEAKDMSHPKIESAFIDYISNIEPLSMQDNAQLDIAPKENHLHLQEVYKSNIEKFEAKEKDIATLYVKEKIDFDEYRKMLDVIVAEKNKNIDLLMGMSENIENQEVKIKEEDIILDIKENWILLNNDEKMQFVQRFIERIVVLNEATERVNNGRVKILGVKFYQN